MEGVKVHLRFVFVESLCFCGLRTKRERVCVLLSLGTDISIST